MACRLTWSPVALADLRDIVAFIAQNDAQAARRVGEGLLEATRALSDFPRKGRIVPEFGIPFLREIQLRPYRLVYRILEEKKTVEIVRIWHAARGKPEV